MENSKKKRNRNIFVIILLVGLLVGVLYFSAQQTTLSTLSISNVNVVGDGAKILVTAVTSGGQGLQINFNPSTLNSYIDDEGYVATQSSTLRAEYVEQTLDFAFITQETDTNAVKLLKTPVDLGFELICNINTCRNKVSDNSVAAISYGFQKCKCVEYRNNGYINGFTGLKKNGFKVIFNLDGETKELTDSSQSISMANGQALISWQGNLLGINEIETPGYDVFHVGSSWYLVDENAFSNVNSGFNSFKSCVGTSGTSQTKYDQCLSTYNNLVNNNIDSKNSQYVNSVSNVDSISFSQGTAKLNLGQPSFRTQFTIELDANKVGIIKLSGKPQIDSCIKNQVFDEAGSNSASATIKNIGNQEGFFDFKITCDNSAMTGYADGIGFNSGESKNINFQLFGGNPGEDLNSASCTLTTTDRNGGGTDSCNFNFDVEYKSGITECIGDETRCTGDLNSLLTCVDGELIESSCSDGCEFTSSGARCISEDGNGGATTKECSWYEEEFTNVDKDYGFLFYKALVPFLEPKTTEFQDCKVANWVYFVTFALIIFTLGYIIINRLFPKKKGGKRRK